SSRTPRERALRRPAEREWRSENETRRPFVARGRELGATLAATVRPNGLLPGLSPAGRRVSAGGRTLRRSIERRHVMPAPSWEPPLAGSDLEHLMGTLEKLRATFRWKADGLTVDQLRERAIPTSELTIGGLLKHLALVEDDVF